MTAQQALAFVKTNGIVLESARGPVPSLAAAIVGEPVRGSWWAHPKASQIFRCSRAVRASPEVAVCRLIGGKVTYVHRRLWPALYRLRQRFDAKQLSAIREIHTAKGHHETRTVPFPDWLPREVVAQAARLSEEEAARAIESTAASGKAA
jgi:hypothetical protein